MRTVRTYNHMEITMKQIQGWWMPSDEHHLDQVMRDGLYQHRQRKRALEGLSRGGLAIDVGAHVGLWLRDLWRHFDEVIAFEPVLAHQECLRANCPESNYTLRTEAVGEHEGRCGMQTYMGNTGHAHRREGTDYPMKAIDSFELKKVKFIKVDVEGFELGVILGAEQTIRESRPRICIEQKPHQTSYPYAARDQLQQWGYRLREHHGDDWVLE